MKNTLFLRKHFEVCIYEFMSFQFTVWISFEFYELYKIIMVFKFFFEGVWNPNKLYKEILW